MELKILDWENATEIEKIEHCNYMCTPEYKKEWEKRYRWKTMYEGILKLGIDISILKEDIMRYAPNAYLPGELWTYVYNNKDKSNKRELVINKIKDAIQKWKTNV